MVKNDYQSIIPFLFATIPTKEKPLSDQLSNIELSIFVSRLKVICDEMGAVLQRSAFSPNIKDRLDFSCAIFDVEGRLSAQAAHIPVHLGSMAFAMKDLVDQFAWQAGDMMVVNDPFLGGTHLPDITVVAPVLIADQLVAFVACRAHHANIGASTPGSMPISTHLDEEGIVIEPSLIARAGELDEGYLAQLASGVDQADFRAQISANSVGVSRLADLVEQMGTDRYHSALEQLNEYAFRLARSELQSLAEGSFTAVDWMDDDGNGHLDIPIHLTLKISEGEIHADFSGTAEQVKGNINCPLSVVAASVYYVFRCLMPSHAPECDGLFRAIRLYAPEGSLLNARRPAAVAAGNVETSTRITDVVLRALAQALPEKIPAASHGSMNNLAMGAAQTDEHEAWNYYETIGGGMGASMISDGLSGVQTHMTNTLNSPVESLEMHFPLRVNQYALRHDSGGSGQHSGGDGLIREFEFLAPASVTVLSERRRLAPWGLAGGADGETGVNQLNGKAIPGKVHHTVDAGDQLTIMTGGGGGWGKSD